MKNKEKEILDNGSRWFRRFVRDARKLSNHIKFKKIKFGFYRIYWVGSGESAYLGECYKEMPEKGYDIEDLNQDLDSKKYYEEMEDKGELVRKIKNFVEGYWDNMDSLRRKVYLLKNNDKEFTNTTMRGYREMKVK